MTKEQFFSAVLKHRIVDSQAIYDPEGYDSGVTLARLDALWEDACKRMSADEPAVTPKCTCEGWRHAGHAPYCALNRPSEPSEERPLNKSVVLPYNSGRMDGLQGSVRIDNNTPHYVDVIIRRVPENRKADPDPFVRCVCGWQGQVSKLMPHSTKPTGKVCPTCYREFETIR